MVTIEIFNKDKDALLGQMLGAHDCSTGKKAARRGPGTKALVCMHYFMCHPLKAPQGSAAALPPPATGAPR